MHTLSSASSTWRACRSASEYTATDRTPSRANVRNTREAISPRFATRTFSNTACSNERLLRPLLGIPHEQAHRRGIVGVAGIVELRAIRDQHDHVALGAKLDVTPR